MKKRKFELVTHLKPQGDQPQAIEKLTEGVLRGYREQTLVGVTGSGKTFTMANVIKNVNKPTLIISHNKTLAAQLFSEFSSLFPNNRVEYFVSYYDYYQPEAYVPQTDTYIEKDASINEKIDMLRHSATRSLLERSDTIVVASVSCIYGLGNPKDYREMMLYLKVGEEIERQKILRKLVEIRYERNDIDFSRGKFRVRGDLIEIYPAYEDEAVRVELWGDEVEGISLFDPVTGKTKEKIEEIYIYPATHYLAPPDRIAYALDAIQKELKQRVKELRSKGKLLEAERLEMRTKYDLEMIREVGYCTGIENYSRYFDGRAPGERPACLIDYFPEDYLMFIDESHQTIPQLHAMYGGDRSRKDNLVKYGFRLPSAYDNRPLKFSEFERLINQVIYVSATPSAYEISRSSQVVEQLIRPTGLVDPKIRVKPNINPIDDLLEEIKKRVDKNQRVLVTTLTKRMAEDLTEYLDELGIRVRYLHSEVETIERSKILRELRGGEFDVLVGINLLREGLDLPEVSLVAILDADKEGFLRSETSIIQTAGRAARNVDGEVILYANQITSSMKRAIEETERRRKIQLEYNRKHNITPRTIQKSILADIETYTSEKYEKMVVAEKKTEYIPSVEEIPDLIKILERKMKKAAEELDFESAAKYRDKIKELKNVLSGNLSSKSSGIGKIRRKIEQKGQVRKRIKI
ncbi:excinuclease ABC subunit UvrB [Candidatus Aerophobetes bacterium]|nr:excinuclease ABC subunit UvrB [Candidatus Aerophobetes bacterium]